LPLAVCTKQTPARGRRYAIDSLVLLSGLEPPTY
jgi:hypothetical protein